MGLGLGLVPDLIIVDGWIGPNQIMYRTSKRIIAHVYDKIDDISRGRIMEL